MKDIFIGGWEGKEKVSNLFAGMVCHYLQHNHVLTMLLWCCFETFDLAICKEHLNPDPLVTSQAAGVPVLAALLSLPEHFINLH